MRGLGAGVTADLLVMELLHNYAGAGGNSAILAVRFSSGVNICIRGVQSFLFFNLLLCLMILYMKPLEVDASNSLVCANSVATTSYGLYSCLS